MKKTTSHPIPHEIVERYCPYVNHNVPIRKGPHPFCMEASHCPIRPSIDCKNDPTLQENAL